MLADGGGSRLCRLSVLLTARRLADDVASEQCPRENQQEECYPVDHAGEPTRVAEGKKAPSEFVEDTAPVAHGSRTK